ncbi:MAG: glycerol-3-phosphate dehydrogenase [Jaaginema sp. PMC 1079.18]|nr:glycerol-3-phosphate dehydrogenase [Jaaginema sp. PMC 1080.18]MEC4850561.1 glycerol-3-phosphate dehydrogenase [Jaaginema sp. PMC 1079.18]MEC4865467.1 glycerol-3-phosphate dehydrogenase [Jaaginema sp. PMC 1078.18]
MFDYQKLKNEQYDLIVIGGGINGAGVVRDAALRGLKTILLEKADFCGGTTSWSTRLIHGGLRYLEYFEFALVRESLREREILLRNAPHLVKPLLLTIPIYGDRSRPYWKVWAGMILYDIFSFDKTLPEHRMLSQKKFRQLFRHLDPEDLSGAAQYYDGQVAYAERLALENIMSAAEAGATVLNYSEVTQLHREGDRITHLTCKNALTGEEFTVTGSDKAVYINTAGPWVDKVLQSGRKDSQTAPISATRKIGPTKGSHIIVDPFPGAPPTSLYVEAKSDGRPFFIVPWLGMYLIGTTDIFYDSDLDKIKASNDEIDYLLRETNLVIPTAKLSRADVKFTYSGVRPLPYTDKNKAGSVTRNHILFDHTPDGAKNLISLIGGKITTYRQVGEEMVEKAYKKMKKTAPPCKTEQAPLPGAILPDDPRIEEAIADYCPQVPLTTVHHLFEVYGAKALDILALTDSEPDLAEIIIPGLPDIKAQIVYAVQSEYAVTLVDITRRRTSIAMHANYGFDALDPITDILKRYCGWTQADCDRQMEYYRTFMQDNCIPDYAIAELALSSSVD